LSSISIALWSSNGHDCCYWPKGRLWVFGRGGFFCGVQLLIQLADVIRDWGYSWLFWETQLALVLPTDGDNLIDPLADDSLAAS
ncbi:hypothetical protein BDQ94DRAFT_132707, partial [Aspergillus welwitschiae]